MLGTILNLLYPERCLICRGVLPFSEASPLCPICGSNYTVTGLICPICEQH
ncbi:MAG: double zinc ribbon domain-containing protein, partial [Dethiobacteria bacterium]